MDYIDPCVGIPTQGSMLKVYLFSDIYYFSELTQQLRFFIMSTYSFDVSTLNTQNQAIVAALLAANGSVSDDHDNGALRTVSGFGVFRRNNKEYVIPLYTSRYFFINPLYLEDDVVHLACGSVGGVIDVESNGGLIQGIESYNTGMKNSPFDWQHDNEVLVQSVYLFN